MAKKKRSYGNAATFDWSVSYSTFRHGPGTDRDLPPHEDHRIKSGPGAAAAILREVRKACASPNRKPHEPVHVMKHDLATDALSAGQRYRCELKGGKYRPIRTWIYRKSKR